MPSYTHVSDFVNHFRQESTSTAKLIESINEAHADAEPTPGVRSLRRLSWHLAKSAPGFVEQMGYEIKEQSNDDKPATIAGIAEVYKKGVEDALHVVEKNMTDANLSEEFMAWGSWKMTKGAMLYLLLTHDIHHRGQMQVTIRMVGGIPVGVVGPTAEEEKAMMG